MGGSARPPSPGPSGCDRRRAPSSGSLLTQGSQSFPSTADISSRRNPRAPTRATRNWGSYCTGSFHNLLVTGSTLNVQVVNPRSSASSASSPVAATMSLEAARNLSIPELLHVLDEKLSLERTRLRGTPLTATPSPESEVSAHWPLTVPHLTEHLTLVSNRSKASKPKHEKF